MPAPSAVEAEHLDHWYGDRQALDGLTFILGSGVTGLVGANGAGKSTLLHLLATVLRPQAGKVLIEGVDLRRHPEAVRRHVALAPQVFVPPGDMRVEEFLTDIAWLRAIRRSDLREEVSRVLSVVELSDRRRDRIRNLSGGMIQRANLAQALLGAPRVILLDEPMDGLDPEQRVRIRQLIAAISEEVCVLLSSHVMDDIVPIAHRILMLDRGRLVFDDTPESLRDLGSSLITTGSDLSPYEAAFLALRERNHAVKVER